MMDVPAVSVPNQLILLQQLKRNLVCLGFLEAEQLSIAEDIDVIRVLCWLEDMKIRHLDIGAERNALRTPNPNWNAAVSEVIFFIRNSSY